MSKNVTAQDAATTCACHKARIAARAVTRAYDEALRPVGLRSTQFTVLVAASVATGVPLNQLATGAHSGGKCRRSHAECRTDATRQGSP
jgi:hypothetical protein